MPWLTSIPVTRRSNRTTSRIRTVRERVPVPADAVNGVAVMITSRSVTGAAVAAALSWRFRVVLEAVAEGAARLLSTGATEAPGGRPLIERRIAPLELRRVRVTGMAIVDPCCTACVPNGALIENSGPVAGAVLMN